MTCTHRYDADDVCVDCGHDDGVQYMRPTARGHESECIYRPEKVDKDKGIRWGGSPCICEQLRACEQRVWKDPLLVVSRRAGWNDALVMAREALAATHRPVPVIECACGWGKDCPECGIESNRIVGYVCDACCNSFGDHAYCEDMHYDDTPLHYQDGQMWSGPHCPLLASIDALKEKQ